MRTGVSRDQRAVSALGRSAANFCPNLVAIGRQRALRGGTLAVPPLERSLRLLDQPRNLIAVQSLVPQVRLFLSAKPVRDRAPLLCHGVQRLLGRLLTGQRLVHV